MAAFEERFWNSVEKTQHCWVWKKCKTRRGYGRFQLDGKTVRAHRLSWELANNKKIPNDLVVMHLCDNPSCVNPSHLKLGTVKENVQDCMYKGRKLMHGANNYFYKNPRKGSANSKCKLTEEQVKEIRQMKGIVLQKDLAQKYGISQSSVSAIQMQKTWGWLVN